MRRIYESSFAFAEFDREKSFLLEKWFPQQISPEVYKKEILQKLEIIQDCKPTLVLEDISEYYFTIAPELQSWTGQVMISMLRNSNLKKYALIYPEEIFAKVSLEQTIRELLEKNPPFEIKVFENDQEAQHWLSQ